jgi:ribosomal protein L37E
MSYVICPGCANRTAYDAPSGKRCIPCGYGLVAKDRQASPSQARKNAIRMSGGRVQPNAHLN